MSKSSAITTDSAAAAATHAPKPVVTAHAAVPLTHAAPKPSAKVSAKVSAKAASKAAAVAAKPAPKPVPRVPDSRFPPAPVPHAQSMSPINRFAERFSPPRPPARGTYEPMETVKTAHKADPKLANAWKSKPGRNLSEPELMAMPEAEYMNEQQLDFFRARLQGLKDDLLSNAGQTTEHLREDTTIVPDPADRATIEEEHALELRTRDRERKLLKKIAQSLTRVDSGDYGFCDETGEPIGLGRLLARPTATLSLEAQQRREMKQKMFGD